MIAAATAGAVGNIFGSILNNEYATQRSRQDRAENYFYGEKAANEADQRTRALYNDFYAPAALLKQYKEAGLSPSLMFGGTPGQGGMSGAQGSGAAGPQTPIFGLDMAAAANLFAQAEKATEEAKSVREKRDPEIANITADTATKLAEAGYKEVATQYTASLKTAQDLANWITDNSKEWQVNEFEWQVHKLQNESNKLFWEGINSKLEYNFNSETYNQKKNLLQESYNNLVADTLQKQTNKKLTEIEINAIKAEIKQKWMSTAADLENAITNYRNSKINKERLEFEIDRFKRQFNIELIMQKYGVEKDIADRIQQMGMSIMQMGFQGANSAVGSAGKVAGAAVLKGL